METRSIKEDAIFSGDHSQSERLGEMSGTNQSDLSCVIAIERPAWRSRRAVAVFLLITISVVVFDLVLKSVSFRYVAGEPVILSPFSSDKPVIPIHDSVIVIPRLLNMQLTTNSGAVFGLGKGGRWIFIIVSVVAGVIIIRLFCKSSSGSLWFHIALSLILGGALGNLYDRCVYHVVRDMLFMFPGTGLWPWIFNLADVALVVGVCLILLITWRGERHRRMSESVAD